MFELLGRRVPLHTFDFGRRHPVEVDEVGKQLCFDNSLGTENPDRRLANQLDTKRAEGLDQHRFGIATGGATVAAAAQHMTKGGGAPLVILHLRKLVELVEKTRVPHIWTCRWDCSQRRLNRRFNQIDAGKPPDVGQSLGDPSDRQ